MRGFPNKFWLWYERHYTLNVSLAAGLFSLQVIHLAWLTGHVVLGRIFGINIFDLGSFWQFIVVLVDYTEIPSLVGVSLVYLNELRKGFKLKNAAYLVFLNSQWLHLFWITDEFVLEVVHDGGTILPAWLAWIAIGIDYLELPVIFDTFKKAFVAVARRIR